MEVLVYYPHSLSHPERCRSDFAELAEMGVSGIIYSSHEQDLKQWPKDIARAAEQARTAGLQVHFQFGRYGGVFTGAWLVPSAYAVRHPDTCLVDLWGNVQPICCPNSERFRDWYLGTTEAVLRAFVPDGVVLDEPKALGLPCACEACRGIAGCESPSGAAAAKRLGEVRAESVARFCADAVASVKRVREGLKVSLLLLPRDELLFDRFCALEGLDRFGTKPYWLLNHEPLDSVRRMAHLVRDLSAERDWEPVMAVQNFGVSTEHEPELRRAFDIVLETQPRCLLLHHFGRNNDRPERVWQITKEAMAKATKMG